MTWAVDDNNELSHIRAGRSYRCLAADGLPASIRDWRKRPGSQGLGIRDPGIAITIHDSGNNVTDCYRGKRRQIVTHHHIV